MWIAIVGIVVAVLVVIFVLALCKRSGTKDDADQKAIEYLSMQSEGRDDHMDELKQKYTEDKQ